MMYVMEGTNSTAHRSRLCYSYRQSSLNMNLDCSFSENYSVSPNIMCLWNIISVCYMCVYVYMFAHKFSLNIYYKLGNVLGAGTTAHSTYQAEVYHLVKKICIK